MKTKITTQMRIARIFEIAPDSVAVLENAGIKCTGCNVNTSIQLAQLIKKHHFDDQKTARLLKHLNNLNQNFAHQKHPLPEDFQLREIQEGNKKYYCVGGLMLTEAAYHNLHQTATAKGLRIKLSTGGCSGFKYEYDYTDTPEKDEKIYQLSEDLAIFMDDFTFAKSHDSILEFKLGLHESGLTIHNPQKKRSCSCGTSIAF